MGQHEGIMGAKKLQVDTWQLLIEAYRNDPSNISAAARHANVSRETAKRALEIGYPKAGTPSILRVLQEEQIKARAALAHEREEAHKLQEKDRAAAREDAINSLKEEGIMVGLGRGTAISALAGLADLGPGVRKLAEMVSKELEAGTTKLNPERAMHLLWKYGATVSMVMQAGHQVMDMERKRLGKPEDILTPEDLLTVEGNGFEDLEREIEMSQRALQSTREGLTIVQGGKNKDETK